jgi:hypothetical protein
VLHGVSPYLPLQVSLKDRCWKRVDSLRRGRLEASYTWVGALTWGSVARDRVPYFCTCFSHYSFHLPLFDSPRRTSFCWFSFTNFLFPFLFLFVQFTFSFCLLFQYSLLCLMFVFWVFYILHFMLPSKFIRQNNFKEACSRNRKKIERQWKLENKKKSSKSKGKQKVKRKKEEKNWSSTPCHFLKRNTATVATNWAWRITGSLCGVSLPQRNGRCIGFGLMPPAHHKRACLILPGRLGHPSLLSETGRPAYNLTMI